MHFISLLPTQWSKNSFYLLLNHETSESTCHVNMSRFGGYPCSSYTGHSDFVGFAVPRAGWSRALFCTSSRSTTCPAGHLNWLFLFFSKRVEGCSARWELEGGYRAFGPSLKTVQDWSRGPQNTNTRDNNNECYLCRTSYALCTVSSSYRVLSVQDFLCAVHCFIILQTVLLSVGPWRPWRPAQILFLLLPSLFPKKSEPSD